MLTAASATASAYGMQTCNNCNTSQFDNLAVSLGYGSHLIVDVPGRTGKIMQVQCTDVQPQSIGGSEGARVALNRSMGCYVSNQVWSSEDQALLEYLAPGMRPDGSFAKSVTITRDASIYDQTTDSLNIYRSSIYANILSQSPGAYLLNQLRNWGSEASGVASNSTITVIVRFSDGSIEATIDMGWVGLSLEPPLSAVTVHLDTARDEFNNLVPGLSQANMEGATFVFGGGAVPVGWESAVGRQGYSTTPGGIGSQWVCGTVELTDGSSVRSCAAR